MLRISIEAMNLSTVRERVSIEREAAWAIELSQRREAVARWRGAPREAAGKLRGQAKARDADRR